MIEIIEKYLDCLGEEFHRYHSWDYCKEVFDKRGSEELKAKELALYLASWGMYRGSGGLLQTNYSIHLGAIQILQSDRFRNLKCDERREVVVESIPDILGLRNELRHHYSSITYVRGIEDRRPISPTDTLITKVLLGTYSCVPAYDRHFLKGLRESGFSQYKFDANSLVEIFDFISGHYQEIEESQNVILRRFNKHYPIMKVIDMYFWQIGYDADLEERRNNPAHEDF